MLLTEAQIHAIKQIIEDHHAAVIVNTIGPDAVAADVLEDLKAKGLVHPKLETAKDAYLYGQVLAALDNPATAKMSYPEFQKWLAKNPVPLSEPEKQAVKMAQLRAAQYVKGLGNRVDVATGQTLIEADAALRNQLKGEIRTQTEEAIARRETVKQLKSDLGWQTQDWTRDWDRIAITEKHQAMQEGLADHLQAKHGPDVLVAKRPMPDACPRCKDLHLGPDGQPRIFTLSTLVAFGHNAGRKAKDWRPSVGAVHPHCQCQLVRVPAGWGFNAEGDLVPGGPKGVRYKDEKEASLAYEREASLRKSLDSNEEVIEFQGLPIVIENVVGSVRRWKDADGNPGETKMRCAYGYIEGTGGQDGDEMDCYVGPDASAKQAFICHQQNPYNGIYDEEKVMLGFPSEEEAQRVYREHYNRDDFLVTVTPMDMDHLKRWLGQTGVEPEKPVAPRFVIMEKGIAPELATADSRADARAPSTHATGVNYFFQAPEAPKPPTLAESQAFDPGYTDHLKGKEKRDAIRKDKRIYDMIEPVHAVTKDVEDIYAKQAVGSPIGTGLAERNREWLDRHEQELTGDGNVAPVPETVQKSESFFILEKGVKGQQALSHRYLKREWMQDHWVYTYAKKHDAKVQGHDTDLNRMVMKFPVDKPGAKKLVAEFRQEHGIEAPIQTTKKYHILTMTKQELGKMGGKQQLKLFTTPEPPKNAPKTVPMKPEDIHTLKELEPVSRSEMEGPPIYPGYKTHGDRVTVNGKSGTLFGYDKRGKPLIQLDGAPKGEYVKATWKEVQSDDKPYQNLYQRLSPDGRVYRLDERATRVMQKVLKVAPLAGKSLSDYTTELRNHAAEVFLVGGAVRDLIASTVGEGKSDEAIVSDMMDMDLVTTADPTAVLSSLTALHPGLDFEEIRAATATSAKNVKRDTKDAQYSGNPKWGVASMFPLGGGDYPGLDIASVVIEKGHAKDWEDPVFDHDLDLDVLRRDFTANALYYDLHNHVVVDPTGMGVKDAQNKVLRIPPMTKDQQYANELLPWRYFKFRTRGWQPESGTLDALQNQLREQLPKQSAHAVWGNLNRTFFKKGKPLNETLTSLEKVMRADGMGDLWDEHVAPRLGYIRATFKAEYEKKKGA